MSEHIEISLAGIRDLLSGRWAIPVDDAVSQLDGPGALACLQGVLTNDVIKPGSPSLVWGAVLTPKGMIVTDLWVRRRGENIVLLIPDGGREAFTTLVHRSFPPRLARVTTAMLPLAAWWLVGGTPEPLDGFDMAVPTETAPFAALAIGPADTGSDLLTAAGWRPRSPQATDVLRLLAGWPVVGREIDDRTLPQEVRFDELQGVKYDKGCFTGQETVARLHFRGHANRTLRAITGSGAPPAGNAIMAATKEVGTVATMATIDGRWLATARIRREVMTGDEVSVSGSNGRVLGFPLTPEILEG